MSLSSEVKPVALAVPRSGVADYVELLKLRLVSLVLVTTVVGYYLGHAGAVGAPFFWGLVHTVLGTAMVAGAAMVFNQWLERDSDGRMRRTMGRPLPEGRVGMSEAFTYGTFLAVAGVAYLVSLVNPLTAALAALTLISYVFVYTPLKTRTPLCTLVGAVPGAIPPMIGYAASSGGLGIQAWVLFAVLFVWQMPHFLAIAWLYRTDYARGGQMMLPVVDPDGASTSRQIVSFSLTLLPVTLMPAVVGMSGGVYFTAALVLGIVFLTLAYKLARSRTDGAARRLFIASVLYLPALLGLMMVDHA